MRSKNRSNLIPKWFPDSPPIYDIYKTYEENLAFGPFFTGSFLKRPPSDRWIDFFGHRIASPLGIAAGPLLGSKWIALASRLGFDILVYKTIRSQKHPAHPLPNTLYVKHFSPEVMQSISSPDPDISLLSITNSFGMPSMSPEEVTKDIEKANQSLVPGQIMIVSIVGTLRPGEDYAEDYVKAALIAKEAGATIIEANFSCPNVKESPLFLRPEAVYTFAKKIKEAINSIPLTIKVGLFPHPTILKQTMIAAAKAGVQGISGINTIPMQVQNKEGKPALSLDRLKSGICGGFIRDAALAFVKNAAKVNKEEKLSLCLIGVGGITQARHFDLFLETGADIAMTATGMMWDPYLAMRWHQRKTDE
jgi:dihydroorotate dehydrogenase (NAD+) catalytic subunit